jgi:hypothetical protein
VGHEPIDLCREKFRVQRRLPRQRILAGKRQSDAVSHQCHVASRT